MSIDPNAFNGDDVAAIMMNTKVVMAEDALKDRLRELESAQRAVEAAREHLRKMLARKAEMES